ncbi:S-layer homology domain-containing protein [Paenibacillus sp. yr247]|uniref:S-layer homology domain-containing protein n=1 Tax=Paenibacillus sp. yr247 TaxID=1761880 RepID=UPI000AB3DE27|nr:S-layer homology domain-containing protein [Paenibacillus sp. yr247]
MEENAEQIYQKVSFICFNCLHDFIFVWLSICCKATTTSVIKGHWAESQINTWIDNGFIKGYEYGSFKPDNTITRAEFIALINRSYRFKEEATMSFSDVTSTNWGYTEVAKAVKAGFITG